MTVFVPGCVAFAAACFAADFAGLMATLLMPQNHLSQAAVQRSSSS